jgi:hypothetical protein
MPGAARIGWQEHAIGSATAQAGSGGWRRANGVAQWRRPLRAPGGWHRHAPRAIRIPGRQQVHQIFEILHHLVHLIDGEPLAGTRGRALLLGGAHLFDSALVGGALLAAASFPTLGQVLAVGFAFDGRLSGARDAARVWSSGHLGTPWVWLVCHGLSGSEQRPVRARPDNP